MIFTYLDNNVIAQESRGDRLSTIFVPGQEPRLGVETRPTQAQRDYNSGDTPLHPRQNK